jgi:hypothetical protein
MNYWKWSNGETYYQSARKYPVKETTTASLNYDTKMNAIEQSLAEDMPTGIDFNEYNNDYMGINSTSSSNNYSDLEIVPESKRESLDNKISDRELVSQRGTNPYSMQTSYVNDVVTRDMFLKPINTTQGRTKNQNNPDGEQSGN